MGRRGWRGEGGEERVERKGWRGGMERRDGRRGGEEEGWGGEDGMERRGWGGERERKGLESYSIDGHNFRSQSSHKGTDHTHTHIHTHTHLLVQATPASSLWTQLCCPHGEWGQSPSSVSCPVHCTSSRWMGPGTDPN